MSDSSNPSNLDNFLKQLPSYIRIGQNLDQKYGKELGSTVREAFIDDCSYIAKILNEEYTDVSNEIAISLTASNLKIGPKIHYILFDTHYGLMIMDQHQVENCWDERRIEDLEDKVKLLHQHGIIHGNLTLNHIFYSDGVIIDDYSHSYYSISSYARKCDIDNLNRIKRTLEDKRH